MNIKAFIYTFPKLIRRPLIEAISQTETFVWKHGKKQILLPHKKKVDVLGKYAKDYSLKLFVETGTYLGQTVDDLSSGFETIFSIELDKKLAAQAKNVFMKQKNIKIFQGDSAKVLKKIVSNLNEPTLFWLDAHYSGGITAKAKKNTPIVSELNIILKKLVKGSVILIDDAREFTGSGGYPKIETIKSFVKSKMKKYKISVKDDIIRIYPNGK